MYDAILENPPSQDEIDPALEKLLQDYLKRMWPTSSHERHHFNRFSIVETPSVTTPAASDETDYVWDIFYHRPGTYTQALMDAVAVGTM